MNEACNSTFFAPPHWAHGKGQKVKISILQLQSQFQRFLYQTLCVFSQMKDIKHIERDFHSVAWVMHAPGVGLGVLGVIFPNMVI